MTANPFPRPPAPKAPPPKKTEYAWHTKLLGRTLGVCLLMLAILACVAVAHRLLVWSFP
jgi:hypothetical protein